MLFDAAVESALYLKLLTAFHPFLSVITSLQQKVLAIWDIKTWKISRVTGHTQTGYLCCPSGGLGAKMATLVPSKRANIKNQPLNSAVPQK